MFTRSSFIYFFALLMFKKPVSQLSC